MQKFSLGEIILVKLSVIDLQNTFSHQDSIYLLLIIEFHSLLKKGELTQPASISLSYWLFTFLKQLSTWGIKWSLEDLQCNQCLVTVLIQSLQILSFFKAIIKATLLTRFPKKAGYYGVVVCLFVFFYLYASFNVLN